MWSSTKNLFLQTYHTSVTIMLHCYMYMYMVCRIRSKLDFTTVPQNASYVTTSTDLKNATLLSLLGSYLRHLFTIQPPRSTRSFSTLALLRLSITSSLKFSNRSIAIAVHLL